MRSRNNPGIVSNAKGEWMAPTPKGPNESLWPSITIEPTDEERAVMCKLVKRIELTARTLLENRLLAKASRKPRNGEMELSGAERYAIRYYIEKLPTRYRTVACVSLRNKII